MEAWIYTHQTVQHIELVMKKMRYHVIKKEKIPMRFFWEKKTRRVTNKKKKDVHKSYPGDDSHLILTLKRQPTKKKR